MSGRREGGMKSELGKATYWRMQWEAASQALADLITEHREDIDAALALADEWDGNGDEKWAYELRHALQRPKESGA